jgi:uncharacterized protein YjbI with pentapeptide repeats
MNLEGYQIEADADLSGADLSGVNLKGPTVTPEELASARSLSGATMPDGRRQP